MMKRIHWCAAVLFLIFPMLSIANKGLPLFGVETITEGQHRYLWLGGHTGLYRYDGSHVQHFNKKSTLFPLQNDWVVSLFAEDDNSLWVAQDSFGLSHFDWQRGTSEHYPLAINLIYEIVPFGQKYILIATSHGVYQLNKQTGHYTLLVADLPVEHLVVDGQRLFLANGDGLYLWQNSKHALISPRPIRAMIDQGSSLWLGLDDGLLIMNKQNFNHQIHLPTESAIISLAYAQPGKNLWAGTGSGEILLIDTLNQRFIPHKMERQNAFGVMALHQHSTGALWVGGLGGVEPAQCQVVQVYEKKHTLFGGHLYLESDGDQIWLAAEYKGVASMDPKTEQITRLDWVNNILGKTRLTDIDKVGSQLYISSFNGLYIFDLAQKNYQHFTYQAKQQRALSSKVLLSITPMKDGRLLIAGDGGGLNIYQPATQDFDQIQLPNNEVINSLELDDGRIVVATAAGVWLLNQDSATPVQLDVPIDVKTIALLAMGDTLWAGTYGQGIYQVNLHGQRLAHYAQADGLANDRVVDLLADNVGNLWVSTREALAKFNLTTRRFIQLPQDLKKSAFSAKGLTLMPNGHVVAAGMYGVMNFDPGTVGTPVPEPVIHFNSVRVSGQAIAFKKGLRITNNNASLNIHFSTVDFGDSRDYGYRYCIAKQCENLGRSHSFNLSHLPEGKHQLQVQAVSYSSQRVIAEGSISIQVSAGQENKLMLLLQVMVAVLCLTTFYYFWASRRPLPAQSTHPKRQSLDRKIIQPIVARQSLQRAIAPASAGPIAKDPPTRANHNVRYGRQMMRLMAQINRLAKKTKPQGPLSDNPQIIDFFATIYQSLNAIKAQAQRGNIALQTNLQTLMAYPAFQKMQNAFGYQLACVKPLQLGFEKFICLYLARFAEKRKLNLYLDFPDMMPLLSISSANLLCTLIDKMVKIIYVRCPKQMILIVSIRMEVDAHYFTLEITGKRVIKPPAIDFGHEVEHPLAPLLSLQVAKLDAPLTLTQDVKRTAVGFRLLYPLSNKRIAAQPYHSDPIINLINISRSQASNRYIQRESVAQQLLRDLHAIKMLAQYQNLTGVQHWVEKAIARGLPVADDFNLFINNPMGCRQPAASSIHSPMYAALCGNINYLLREKLALKHIGLRQNLGKRTLNCDANQADHLLQLILTAADWMLDQHLNQQHNLTLNFAWPKDLFTVVISGQATQSYRSKGWIDMPYPEPKPISKELVQTLQGHTSALGGTIMFEHRPNAFAQIQLEIPWDKESLMFGNYSAYSQQLPVNCTKQ